jgi:hypothetical protein
MNTYLGYVQAVANQLPVHSLVDTTFKEMDDQELLEHPKWTTFTEFNEKSINAAKQVASRILWAYFVYPRLSSIFFFINASIGIIHLGVGFTERFRTLEGPEKAPEKWKSIAQNTHKGITHLLVASYDLGIGVLLNQKYIGLAGVAIFAGLPIVALVYHQKVFKKPNTNLLSSETHQKEVQQIQLIVKGLTGKDIIPTEQNTPSPAQPSKYLDNTCLIYTIAKKLTLELMPKSQPENKENPLLKDAVGAGGEATAPNYGL